MLGCLQVSMLIVFFLPMIMRKAAVSEWGSFYLKAVVQLSEGRLRPVLTTSKATHTQQLACDAAE